MSADPHGMISTCDGPLGRCTWFATAWNARHHLACDSSHQTEMHACLLGLLSIWSAQSFAELYRSCKVRREADRTMVHGSIQAQDAAAAVLLVARLRWAAIGCRCGAPTVLRHLAARLARPGGRLNRGLLASRTRMQGSRFIERGPALGGRGA